MLCISLCTCCTVPCFGRNPNWCEGMALFAANIGVSLFSINFSKILDSSGRRLMGLYDVTSVGFLPGFGIMNICPIFQWHGKYSCLKIALYICVIARMPFLSSSFRIFPVMRSYPGALVGWVSHCIIYSTSCMRIFDGGGAIWWGVSNCCRMSSSIVLGNCGGRGRKTVAKCSANVSAFCLSVRAQVSSGFRIGGMCCWGRFSFRVVLHSE